MSVGERIKELRKRAHLTQAELAAKCGLATITVQQYETNKRHPRAEQLEAIAAGLGVPLVYLFGDDRDSAGFELEQLANAAEKVSEFFGPREVLKILAGKMEQADSDSQGSASMLLNAYNKALVDADTVDAGLMALLIQKNQHCTLEQAKELAEVVAKCIQVGGDSAKAALSFDRIDDAQKPAALAMLRALERNELKK